MHYYPLGVLFVSWVIWIWDTYLELRQYKVYKTTTSVPKVLEKHIDVETLEKSRRYCLDKARFGIISGLFGQIQSTLTIYYFLMPTFWKISSDVMTDYFGLNKTANIEWEIFQSLLFTLITSLVSTLIGLPLSVYYNFVIEERHGFNKQTAGFYVKDKIKGFFVSFIITAPIVAAMIYIVRSSGPYFFVYLWALCFVVMCLLIFFQGEIAAIFDKFSSLPECELRNKIEKLSTSINFPLQNIFIVEGSKRSSHSNAYQSGIFKKKRIVIYDTLIEGNNPTSKDEAKAQTNESKPRGKGFNDEEILAVVCHELGHWYCSHLWKQLGLSQINIFLMFLCFSKFHKDPVFFAGFGFHEETPVIIGLSLFMMILAPYNEIQGIITTFLSRRFEYQADNFAKIQGYANDLKAGLIKLNVDNLGFPVYDELYSMFNHSHPTLIQRLKALEKTE